MPIYPKNNKNWFFFLISWPTFILFVLSDRARWRLQNLYTKFWKFINYANLCKCIQNKKNHKKCFFSFISQPILIWFALSGRAKFGTLYLYTELWDSAPLINYGNLCKFIQKKKKIASSPSFLYWFSFCLFYLIGLVLFLCPFWGINFFFLTSRKLYHMKFAIFDVARCRMSATSLTFLLRIWALGIRLMMLSFRTYVIYI